MFGGMRRSRRIGAGIRGLLEVTLLRVGLNSGIFAALREPAGPKELSNRLGTPTDLTASFLRAAHAHGLLNRSGTRYRLGPLVRWLLDAPEAEAARALLDQTALVYAPSLSTLPELLRGAPRPHWGGDEAAALRAAQVARVGEKRTVAALRRIPGVRSARWILDVGCGTGSVLARLLIRHRDARGLGVELHPGVAERASRTLREAGVHRRAEIVTGDFMEVELDPAQFDLVLLNNNLHYFGGAERRRLLGRIFEHLAPGGVLAIETPVLAEDRVSRAMGVASLLASFDLFLRAHDNLHGLPDLAALAGVLRELGFAEQGEVAVLPGGSIRYVWARRGRGSPEPRGSEVPA